MFRNLKASSCSVSGRQWWWSPSRTYIFSHTSHLSVKELNIFFLKHEAPTYFANKCIQDLWWSHLQFILWPLLTAPVHLFGFPVKWPETSLGHLMVETSLCFLTSIILLIFHMLFRKFRLCCNFSISTCQCLLFPL